MSPCVAIAAAAAAVAIAAAPPLAHADPAVVLTSRIPASGTDAPAIIATVTEGPDGADPARWSVAVVGADPPIELHATAIRPYAEIAGTVAVVFLIEGLWVSLGDVRGTSIRGDVLAVLGAAPDAFRGITPRGSLGAIVRYDRGATVLAPMTPLGRLDAAAFGTHADYAHIVGRDLVAGVETSIDLLRHATTDRKVLIIVGDGADTKIDAAKTRLAELATQCDLERIERYAIVVDSPFGAEPTAIRSLHPASVPVIGSNYVPEHLEAIAQQMAARYEVEIAGRGFPWDGKQHLVELRLDGMPWPPDTEPVPFPTFPTEAPRPGAPATSSLPWLLAIGLLVAAAAIYALVRFLPNRGR